MRFDYFSSNSVTAWEVAVCVSIVYGKDPCYASSAVCDYKDTISEKEQKPQLNHQTFCSTLLAF